MDEYNFNKFIEEKDIYNPNIECVFFSSQIQVFRPTHNDTWYFVLVATYGSTWVNFSTQFTDNYYPEQEQPEDPEPDPEPEPENQDLTINGYELFLIFPISITPYLISKKRKKIKKN
ncbi:MAG: hypothetical protein EU549_03135 [Promethearchaeota archaeon]|nr:MAG: hypothetical protein EU549_03135 [Candidatus Lokiarchaeota archaeon]